jgi:hypothetical protein
MDTRGLRKRIPASFTAAADKARTLRDANDDGFALIEGDERLKVCGPFVVAAWELRPPLRKGGVDMATVYGYAPGDDGTLRPIKMVFGGSGLLSIPGMLQQWQDNGITDEVAVTLTADQRPGFLDDQTGEEVAPYWRYSFEDTPESTPDY